MDADFIGPSISDYGFPSPELVGMVVFCGVAAVLVAVAIVVAVLATRRAKSRIE